MAELIDLPAFAAAFGRMVHDAGIPVTPERSARFAEAISLGVPQDRASLYWTARTVFVSGPEQREAFDAVFALVFDAILDPAAHRGDQQAPPLTQPEATAQLPEGGYGEAGELGGLGPLPEGIQVRGEEEQEGGDAQISIKTASLEERLSDRDFSDLEPDELIALYDLMRRLAVAPPPRRARRYRRRSRGERIDLRATLRRSRRTGGDPAYPVRRSRVERPRRIVLVCDISGSMEPYARAYLQLLHAAVCGAGAEAFVFATRLTRLTRAMRGRRPDDALARVTERVRDFSSGTRLGESLASFNDLYGRRGVARGAVVVIISDGWEQGDPAVVALQMERLARLAHRIVWVNPRKARPGFEPLTGGMAAALPHCDAFVSGHSLRALSEVADAIAG